MSLFDYYEPDPPLCCPVCRHHLEEWQGKDGDCAMFVWRQGFSHPIGQRVESDIALSPNEIREIQLPHEFSITSYDCDCPFPVTAECTTDDNVWDKCMLVTADNAYQWVWERRHEFNRRLAWLKGKQ